MTTTTTTLCRICGTSNVEAKAQFCGLCNSHDGEVYRSVAQLKKAIKIHDALVQLEAQATEVPFLPDFARRMVEKVAEVPESSDTTWALATFLLRTDSEK